MRTCTIALSIVVHVMAACAAIIAPLLAADQLPAPRTATEFIQVVAEAPPPPPPAAHRPARRVVEPTRADVPPLTVPDGIQPESLVALQDVAPVDSGVISFGDCNCAIGDAVAPPPPPPQVPIIRVGGNIRPPQKVSDVAPMYPAIAREARVQGVVILEAVIGEEGAVRDVRVLRSIPLLDTAAIEAVHQWRYTPTLLNGEPVPVVMAITVAFKLN